MRFKVTLTILVILALALAIFLSSQGVKREAKQEKERVEWSADGVVSPGEYDKELELAGGRFKVYWRVEGGYAYIALVGKTKGWVAIGFGPTEMMKDADMVIGWVKEGKVTVIDAYSTGVTGPHPPDEKLGGRNDITEFGGKEDNGITTIEFKRKQVTGDKYDRELKGTVKFIYAMADEDVFTKKHNVAKGYGEITLG